MDIVHATTMNQLLVFILGESRYALNLWAVERVVRAVEITTLPKAPNFIAGVINVQGQVVTVVDVRLRLNLPSRDLQLDDKFILAHTARRLVALMVDSVESVHEVAERELADVEQVLPGTEYIRGLVKLNDGLVLICDLDQFLSTDDEQKLDEALAGNNI